MEDFWTPLNTDERNAYFRDHEYDCRFLVGKEGKEIPIEFKSYKFILTNISLVFKRMFSVDAEEAKNCNEAIVLNDIAAKHFDNFLQLAYYREIKRKCVDWKGVYTVAKKYLSETIIGFVICELGHHIICNPNPIENLNFFEIVHMEEKSSLFCPSMESPIDKAFNMHFYAIYRLERKVFRSICTFVKQTEPLTRFRVLENYCVLNDIERNQTVTSEDNQFVESCLELIDFSTLTLQDFTDFVEKSDLLFMNEKYEILLEISKKLAYKLRDLQIENI